MSFPAFHYLLPEDCVRAAANTAHSRRAVRAAAEVPRHDSLAESQTNCGCSGTILAFPEPVLSPRLNLIAPDDRARAAASTAHSRRAVLGRRGCAPTQHPHRKSRPPDVRLPIRSAAPTPVAVLGPKRAFSGPVLVSFPAFLDQNWLLPEDRVRAAASTLAEPLGRPEEPRHDSLTESQANCGPILAFPGPILSPRLNLIAPRRSCPSSRKHSTFSPSRLGRPRMYLDATSSPLRARLFYVAGSNPTSRGDRLAEPTNV